MNNNEKKSGRFGMVFFIVLIALLVGYLFFSTRARTIQTLFYTTFLASVAANQVSEVHLIDHTSI